MHPRAPRAADAAASRAAMVSESSSCFAFLAAEVDAEGSPEAAAGVASSLARVGSLPDWLGTAVSCDLWSAGPIIQRPVRRDSFLPPPSRRPRRSQEGR